MVRADGALIVTWKLRYHLTLPAYNLLHPQGRSCCSPSCFMLLYEVFIPLNNFTCQINHSKRPRHSLVERLYFHRPFTRQYTGRNSFTRHTSLRSTLSYQKITLQPSNPSHELHLIDPGLNSSSETSNPPHIYTIPETINTMAHQGDRSAIISGSQTETVPDSDAGKYATDSTPSRRDSAMHSSSSDLDLLMTLCATGRVTRKEYLVYRKLYDERKLSKITFHPITTSHPNLSAVSKVFNNREFLEMILLNVKSGDLFMNVQRTCRGLKNSIETSETLCRRPIFAMRRTIGFQRRFLRWDVVPKCMSFQYETPGRLAFKLGFTELSFERHRCNESFRRLCVSELMPQRIEVLWREEVTSAGGQGNEMIWMKSVEGGKPINFGQIFDAVAERVSVGKKVGGLSLFLSQDDQLYGGPWLPTLLACRSDSKVA
jgi:hypothetical protein